MRVGFRLCLTFLLPLLASAPAFGAAHTHVRLILGAEIARPGDEVLAGVDLKTDQDWHTYWKNSVQSGIPTTISWELPPGITATIRLVYFPGTDKDDLPAVVDCGGRMDLHGAPLSRTWVKLGQPSKPDEAASIIGCC